MSSATERTASGSERVVSERAAAADAACDASMPWYAVWVRSHHEHIVGRQLSAKGFHTFLPLARGADPGGRGEDGGRLPLFPGYLFVRESLSKERYIDLLKARGVVRVLADGWTRLTPLPPGEIDAIQRAVESRLPIAPHGRWHEGEPVRVIRGPLAGVTGLFVRDARDVTRLVLSVELLGRSVSLEMDGALVEPAEKA